jgi:hypothetical protein
MGEESDIDVQAEEEEYDIRQEGECDEEHDNGDDDGDNDGGDDGNDDADDMMTNKRREMIEKIYLEIAMAKSQIVVPICKYIKLNVLLIIRQM